MSDNNQLLRTSPPQCNCPTHNPLTLSEVAISRRSPTAVFRFSSDNSLLRPRQPVTQSQVDPFAKIVFMQFPEFVEARSDVMGKPCLQGTRIPVYLILEKLAAGETSEIILAAHPQLKPEHIEASLEYAARLAAGEIVLTNQ
jgi:uncharacterized protein (DUF433 family)